MKAKFVQGPFISVCSKALQLLAFAELLLAAFLSAAHCFLQER